MHQLRFLPLPVSSEHPEHAILHRLSQFLLQVGRVVKFKDFIRYIRLVDCSIKDMPADELYEYFQKLSNIFYTFEISNTRFVALSRTYLYLNSRIAKKLAVFTDIETELLLNVTDRYANRESRRTPIVGSHQEEYCYAKASLAMKGLLEMISQTYEQMGEPFHLTELLIKCPNLVPLSRQVFQEVGDLDDYLKQLAELFGFFKTAFQVDESILYVNELGLEAIIRVFEIDLLWGFTGICGTMDITSIPLMTKEINCFIDRADLRIPPVTEKYVTESLLRCRVENFFLPGDDTVWQRIPVCCVSTAEHTFIDNFFLKYLQKEGKIHYMNLVKCVSRNFKDIFLEKFKFYTSVDLATCMYGPLSPFDFTDGYMHLAQPKTAISNHISLVPYDVPFNVLLEPMRWCKSFKDKFCGIVLEKAIQSAVIRVQMCLGETSIGQSDTFMWSLALCHVSTTTIKGQKISTFYDILDLDDEVVFTATFVSSTDLYWPYHFAVLDIQEFPKMIKPLKIYPKFPSRAVVNVRSRVPVCGLHMENLLKLNYGYDPSEKEKEEEEEEEKEEEEKEEEEVVVKKSPRVRRIGKICSFCSKDHALKVETIDKIYSTGFALFKKKLCQMTRLQQLVHRQLPASDIHNMMIFPKIVSHRRRETDDFLLLEDEVGEINNDIAKMAITILNTETEMSEYKKRGMYLALLSTAINIAATTIGLIVTMKKTFHIMFGGPVNEIQGPTCHVEVRDRPPRPPNRTKPPPNKTKPSPKTTKPSPKTTKPSPNKPKPSPNKPKPSPNKTKPPPNKPKPKPSPNKPKPPPNKAEPSPNKTKPPPNKAEPSSKKTKPLPNKPKPSPNQPKPLPNKPEPSPNQSKPPPNQPEPSPDKTKPLPNKTKPPPNKPKPSPNQPKPPPNKPKPSPIQPEPSLNKPKPSPNQPKPSPNQPKPSPNQPKPSPKEPEPSPNKPKPPPRKKKDKTG